MRILKDDLEDEDVIIQVEAAKKLGVIAKALGAQKARTELIEYLEAYEKKTENDEALVALGEALSKVAKCLGGPEHMGNLIPLLETLTFQEETVVCEAAATTYAEVLSQMPSNDIEKSAMPSLEKMATANWFQPRVSVSKLFPAAFPKLGESSQEKVIKWFNTLRVDDNPMVKKAALLNMGALANVMGKKKGSINALKMLKEVCEEESDFMRMYALDVCKEMLKSYNETKEFKDTLWPLIKKLTGDTSWRVRKQLASSLPEFAKTAGTMLAGREMLPIYIALLKDNESEVKTAATANLVEMCKHSSSPKNKEGIAQVATVLKDLIEDTSQVVRAQVSKSLGDLAAMSEGKTTEGIIFDVMKLAVKDEDAVVRCNTLESIQKIAKNLKSAPATLLQVLQPFASDPKWRVRREYLRASTAFASVTAGSSENEGFESKLISNLIECLSDHISSIREEACVQLATMVKIKGNAWGVKKLLPEALKAVSQTEMAEQSNYITRMTGLILLSNVSAHLSPSQIAEHVCPFIEQCLKDGVENVRFKAARAASKVIPLLNADVVRKRIVPALEEVQKGEQDSDILFYAEEALYIAASKK
eukprot:CAMPEP_0167761258 /NCGR_PEP_ID=MMETSP0110_2-20121227/12068_1 /TAXON_ID=629695 /ORGANISM="Gymnochlora sp., Strain CCMP2014" /LENGTH=589 /DNA_ID=CAMNT_0007647913 /DNA_START=58 /DNA_END=1827 /DNA_ORIENTATION=+